MIIDIRSARLKNCEDECKDSFVRVLVVDKFFVDNGGFTVWDDADEAEEAVKYNSEWWKVIREDAKHTLQFLEQEETEENLNLFLDKVWRNMINTKYVQIITYYTDSWQPKRTL